MSSQPPPYPPQPPPYPQPHYQQPFGAPPPPPPPKPGGALKWILVGVGFLVLCVLGFIGVGAFLAYRAIQNVGFDPDLMQRNPGLALARMATALNPDAELVSTNEAAGTVTIREKSSGKVITLKFDPDKKTMVVIDEQSGERARVQISGDDQQGSIDITGGDGKIRLGSSGDPQPPAWAPVFPGSSTQGVLSAESPEGATHTFTFKTSSPPAQVLAYYETQLKDANFNVTSVTRTPQGSFLMAEDAGQKRILTVGLSGSAEGTEGSITAIEKK
jgi:hypothetical protein